MIKVLDHGYVSVVQAWGTEAQIIEAARMSTNKGFKGWDEDQKLLAYLYNHKHMTPFEMCGAILEIKAPIFVFREWHRHRTQSYNEMSARYIPLPDENYLPTLARVKMTASANKQAQGGGTLGSDEELQQWLNTLEQLYKVCQEGYEDGLSLGIPKEIARLIVPVARYSKMRANANLRNWLQFLQLRLASNAQWEIRQYAEAVMRALVFHFPRTMSLFLTEIGYTPPQERVGEGDVGVE